MSNVTIARIAAAATAITEGDLKPIHDITNELMCTEGACPDLLKIASHMCAQANQEVLRRARKARLAAAVRQASEGDTTGLIEYQLAGADLDTVTIVSCTNKMADKIAQQSLALVGLPNTEVYLTPFEVE